MIKLIVAGSRNITDYEKVKRVILMYYPDLNIEIVSGGAKGVDTLGERFAREFNLPVSKFPADWMTHGRKAGPLRNIEMGNYADELLAFWDGESKGTKHMIDYMRKSNKLCVIIY